MSSTAENENPMAARRARLMTDMEQRGLGSYERHLRSDYWDSYDEKRIVESYIDREYPTLGEVVSMLAPFVREKMLKEEGLWFPNDPRCLLYVEGDSKWPTLSSIKTAIEEDQRSRQSKLSDELISQGLSGDFLNVNPLFELDHAFKNFVEGNEGSAGTIAAAAGIQYRLKELEKSFAQFDLYLPYEVETWQDGLSESRTDYIKYYKNRLEQCDSRVQSFVLETQCSATKAEDLAVELNAEREMRKKMVNDKAAELSVDLEEQSNHDLHGRLIDNFVNSNAGNYVEILGNILLESKLKKHWHKMPCLNHILNKIPSMAEKVKLACLEGNEGIDRLCCELFEEKETRLFDIRGACVVTLTGSRETLLPSWFEDRINESEYVRFGIGDQSHEVNNHVAAFRMRELHIALNERHLKSPKFPQYYTEYDINEDGRFQGFIDGTCGIETAKEFVEHLCEAEDSRRNEIDETLSKFYVTTEGDAIKAEDVVGRFIKYGQGTSSEVVQEALQSKRQSDLRNAFKDANLLGLYWEMKEVPLCKEFIKGSIETADFVVASLVEQRSTREVQLKRLVGRPDFTIESFEDIGDLDLCRKVREYIAKETGDVQWIADAVSCQLYHKDLEVVFGGLSGMLSCANYENLYLWMFRRKDELAPLAKEIHSKLFPPHNTTDGFILKQFDSEHVDESEQSLAQLILDFAGPTFNEFFMHELPRRCDSRLALLLAKSHACPWSSPEEAVRVLRQERKARKAQINKLFPPSDYPASDDCVDWTRTSVSMMQLTEQDIEDSTWAETHTRACYINGLISIDEASTRLFREKRVSMLNDALEEGSLSPELAKKDERCISFVNQAAKMDEAEEILPALIQDLHTERIDRLRLLGECFDCAGIVDIGFNVKLGFPATERFNFVDFGQGSAEDVVRAVIVCQREKSLKSAVSQHFSEWRSGEVEAWMRNHEACTSFVHKPNSGKATHEELKSFISVVASQDHRKPSIDNDDYRVEYEYEPDDYDEMWN